MTGRATMLPVIMVTVILVVAIVMITSNQEEPVTLTGDPDYPHHICTFRDFCEGSDCDTPGVPFVLYPAHANGQPRLEMPRHSPGLEVEPIGSRSAYVSRGGAVEAQIILFDNLSFEYIGTSGDGAEPTDHNGIGSCSRLEE